jgi:hypothetical protein
MRAHLGDITDAAGLTAALAGADAAVHTAVGAGGETMTITPEEAQRR